MDYYKKILVGGIAGLILLGGAVTAFAVESNGSFETGPTPGSFITLNSGDSSITGWTVDSGSIDYIDDLWTASQGERSIDLSGNSAGSISQTITTVPGHTYKVTFDLAGNPAGEPTVKTLNVEADGTVIPYSFDTSGKTLSNLGWDSQTFNFVAVDNSTVLKFVSTTNSAYGPALDNVNIEDVTVVTPTVTPTTVPTSVPTIAPTGTIVPAECNQNVSYNVINGTNNSEVINGTNGRDLIFALGGSDRVNGMNGGDCIVGGDGSDSINGGNGNDVILGEAGSDDLRGGNDNDKLYGGAGSDSLRGDNGNDTLDGQANSDVARGGNDTDTCSAEAELQCEN